MTRDVQPARGARNLWCFTRPDLFAPALAQAGLKSDRVIYLEGGDDKTVLACFEEGLRQGGLGAAVAEIARLPMAASRRLQLGAEESGTIGVALRRWRRQGEVVHLVAYKIAYLSAELAMVGDRDAAFPLPHGRGDQAGSGGGPDPRDLPPKGLRTRDIYIPDLHIDTIRVKARDFG